MTDLEERSIEALTDRCENCGATLTGAEKRTALERGTTPVCAAEQSTAVESGEDFEADS